MSRNDLYDVIVIGGGPAGLTAGLYLARARYRVLILEKDDFGGQITITNEVVNYPGVGRTTGRALTQTMRQQAQDFGAEFLSAEAIGLDVHGDVKTVHTSRGDLKAFGILLATGASPRKLGFEGEPEYAGRGVAYCATCDGEFFSEMEPEELVATLDFRYLTDALTPQEALEILRAAQEGKAERIAHLKEVGYPGYSTAAGWLGYSDEKMVRLAKQETEVMGFKQIKLKVGQNLEDDLRRLKLAREAVGPDIAIAVDANQVWDVPQAIEWIGKFNDYDLAWVEEPTCPDDVLGHAAIQKAIDPIPVATGEQMQNRVMYKQYLQAGSFKVMQIDATRVAGPQEIVLEYLLAKKFGVKVCPHAGGVGLCEAISQLAMFDYVSVSGEMEDRVVEYVDNQHEYFVHPTVIKNGRYVAPLAPGNGTEMKLDECMKYLHKD